MPRPSSKKAQVVLPTEPTSAEKTERSIRASREANKLAGSMRVEVSEFNVFVEGGRLFNIGLPSILMQFALYWIFPLSAAAVGTNLGPVELGGFSLGALVGNLSCLTIMEGSLTAADTLMPRAYGARQYDEVGRLAVRAFGVGTLLLSIPIIPLCLFISDILQSLGQNKEASDMAQAWIRMYFIGAPPNLVFRVFMRFLLAQSKPWPLVVSSTIPAIVLHPFLLNYFVPRFGLQGSALSISITQWVMLIILMTYLWIRPAHKPATWPGLSMQFVTDALRWGPTQDFLRLSLGGILSMNEWWFFEVMCFIAGSFGVVSLDAHTVAYNLVPLLFMFPLGVSIGLAVRMGNVIAMFPAKAKKLAAWCMGFMASAGLIISYALNFFRYEIIQTFTNDVEVLEMALQIWPYLCYYVFLIYIMGISLAILRALGMQWRAAGIITGTLYCLTLPLVLYFAVYEEGGLIAQWRVLPFCYTFLQVALAMGYILLDWEDHASKIREGLEQTRREATDTLPQTATETTPLTT